MKHTDVLTTSNGFDPLTHFYLDKLLSPEFLSTKLYVCKPFLHSTRPPQIDA